MSERYAAWIGNTEEKEELISLAQVQAAAATLDDSITEFVEGVALPPLWQWFFFLPRVCHSQLDADGHPRFIHSGTYEELIAAFGLTPRQIAARIQNRVKS
jgi:hydroxyacyl-ACP dehydratase HTD2-like protein with hotdog domain